MNLDPGDRAVARKAARDAATEDLLGLDEYIKDHPTLVAGYPADPVSAAFEELYRTGIDLDGYPAWRSGVRGPLTEAEFDRLYDDEDDDL